MATTYTISELAQEFSITPRTLRHYEEQGLLHPQRDGLNRLFSARDRARLRLALRGKRLGFSLSDLRELFELHDRARDGAAQRAAFLAKLDQYRAQLERQREDLDILLGEMRFFASQLQGESRASSIEAAAQSGG
jgi:DNA-binding transcriptional MerR regulator